MEYVGNITQNLGIAILLKLGGGDRLLRLLLFKRFSALTLADCSVVVCGVCFYSSVTL